MRHIVLIWLFQALFEDLWMELVKLWSMALEHICSATTKKEQSKCLMKFEYFLQCQRSRFQVSFKTTVGGDVKPFEDGQFRGFSLSKVYSSVYGLFFLSVSVFIDHFYGIECHSCGRPKN